MTRPGETREALLARTFVALADTLVDDYDVVEMLDHLVNTCVSLLGVSQAGLMLTDQRGALHLVASSNEATRIVELFQLQGAEGGPCVQACRTGVAVNVEDLARETPWPHFAATAATAGFRSVHAVPMRWRDTTLGALNLFNEEPPSLGTEDQQLARAFADVATIAILQQRSLHRSSQLVEQLQFALNSRIVIEQAKGVLAEHGKVGMDTAFVALRGFARNRNLKLAAVAEALVRREQSADEILDASPRLSGPENAER
jgi:GAF domain-containing protein